MDTRRSPGQGTDGRAGHELGTDTVPVELVDLQPVGGSGGGRASRAPLVAGIVVIAIVGLIVVGGQLLLPPSTPSPSVVVPPSATPTPPVAVTTPRPSPTPRQTVVPTPRPTPPPAWQWTQSLYDLDSGISDEGAWGVGDAVLVPSYLYSNYAEGFAWGIARITDHDMNVFEAPPAITELWGSSVIGGRLWFLARVTGVTEEQATWQFVSTADGRSWESLGPASGLDQLAAAAFVRRVGGTWVAWFWLKGDGGIGAPTPASLMWSTDGVQWRVADVPDGPGVLQVRGVGQLGDSLIIVGSRWESFEAQSYVVLRSTDGRSWHESSLQVPSWGRPDELVCADGQCLITVPPIDDEESLPNQVLLRSTDGVTWDMVASDIPYDGPDAGLRDLQVTTTGFIATTYSSPTVWLSEDGRSWWNVEVLPPGAASYFKHLAVSGDMVVGLVEGASSDEPNWIWRGSLEATAAAPH